MTERKSFLGYYRQFEGMSEEEVNLQLRAQSEERKRVALARVEPLVLDRTTWPEYPHPAIVNAITYAARRGLHRYLDRGASQLSAELAHRHGIAEEQLVIGDGAAQLIDAAIHALLEPSDELITPWPSYYLYPQVARRSRGHAVPVPGFGIEPLLAAVNDRTRIVALCNPNDPTGEMVGVDDLRTLLEGLPERVVVLLDEALRDFVDAEDTDAALALLKDHPRLLIFRTFSKAWGLAGLRVGYAIGGPGAEPLLEQLAPELGLNELAQAGALEAVRTVPHVIPQRRATVVAERVRIYEGLRELGMHAAPSQANFFWLSVPGPHGAAELVHRLERAEIRVAGGGPLGAPDHVRITIPHRPHLTDRLLRALGRD